MRGHLGAVLTSGLAAVALALALLQAIVLAHGAPRYPEVTAARSGTSNRYSVPGGRSGIPFIPFDKARPPDPGQTPQRQQEEHRSPPPSRMRAVPPHPGPQQPRKLAA
ncbi:MAG: hypothetical protein E6J88_12560 [Deltaproteobacteria bacterium]|nr:MAG: hypothetical protein E6J88_12560 [Deltaproteobacteria bacterium]